MTPTTRVLLALPLVALAMPAAAWECKVYTNCCCCGWQYGSTRAFKINTNDFTAAGADEIAGAAFAWNAGSIHITRGATWSWTRTDVTVDGTIGNGENNVRKKDDTWFTNQGYSANALAGTNRVEGSGLDACTTVEADITYRESLTYSTSLPSQNPPNSSIGQIAVHEFGHALGFIHEDTVEAAMNSSYPAGGDLGEVGYLLHEDDYVGLTNAKSGASTGKTLALSKFRATTAGDTQEVWTDGAEIGNDWDGRAGDTITAANGPTEILAVIVGTGTESPVIEWTLDPGSVCFSGTEYSLGTRTPSISANTPYPVSPNSGYVIPAGTPVGTYKLCAKIDSTNSISETTEVENIVRSDKDFEVIP